VAAVKRPNILLFVTDQQQARTICNQSPCNTPNINRLAAEGLRFDRAYATVALCCPSRAALISGQYPSTMASSTRFMCRSAHGGTWNPES